LRILQPINAFRRPRDITPDALDGFTSSESQDQDKGQKDAHLVSPVSCPPRPSDLGNTSQGSDGKHALVRSMGMTKGHIMQYLPHIFLGLAGAISLAIFLTSPVFG
jgi:hypothetical protein